MGNKRAGKEKRVIKGLDNVYVLTQLLDLASQLNITVRQEKGDFQGGSCRVEKDRIIFLKKLDSDSSKIDVLARELAKLDFNTETIDPNIYQLIKQFKSNNEDARITA